MTNQIETEIATFLRHERLAGRIQLAAMFVMTLCAVILIVL